MIDNNNNSNSNNVLYNASHRLGNFLALTLSMLFFSTGIIDFKVFVCMCVC